MPHALILWQKLQMQLHNSHAVHAIWWIFSAPCFLIHDSAAARVFSFNQMYLPLYFFQYILFPSIVLRACMSAAGGEAHGRCCDWIQASCYQCAPKTWSACLFLYRTRALVTMMKEVTLLFLLFYLASGTSTSKWLLMRTIVTHSKRSTLYLLLLCLHETGQRNYLPFYFILFLGFTNN